MPATIEVICGPMFSGKTEELVRRIMRNRYARKRDLIVKPIKDTRNNQCIVTRGIDDRGKEFPVYTLPALTITNPYEIVAHLEREKPDLLAIDEAHLFESMLIEVIDGLREDYAPNLRIIVSGLDMDYRRRSFSTIAHCMAIADRGTTKLQGVCMKCRVSGAAFTQARYPLTSNQDPGSGEKYEVRCRACHTIP